MNATTFAMMAVVTIPIASWFFYRIGQLHERLRIATALSDTRLSQHLSGLTALQWATIMDVVRGIYSGPRTANIGLGGLR